MNKWICLVVLMFGFNALADALATDPSSLIGKIFEPNSPNVCSLTFDAGPNHSIKVHLLDSPPSAELPYGRQCFDAPDYQPVLTCKDNACTGQYKSRFYYEDLQGNISYKGCIIYGRVILGIHEGGNVIQNTNIPLSAVAEIPGSDCTHWLAYEKAYRSGMTTFSLKVGN